jgi:predicted DNA repair protein MutK
MAAVGLLALLDDIAALLDDVALMTRAAVQKTAGVIGDDLALNAEQVTGMRPERELPVVWAVAKGALLNKLILIPTALLISAFLPRAVTPLLMLGGAVLCYEGFTKLWAKLRPAPAGDGDQRAARRAALADPAVDLVAWERERIRGAVRTDFILSAEIVVIALGAMTGASVAVQAASLTAVGLGVTVLVYGPVAGLVKLDDVGLRLHGDAGASPARRQLGALLLRAAPRIMQLLSILGTTAMFLVGGGILVHGIPALEQLVIALLAPLAAANGTLGSVARVVVDGLAGVAAGGILAGIGALRPQRPSPAASSSAR